MSEIIIYGSQYGTTRMYAEELSKITKIQAISFEEIKDIPGCPVDFGESRLLEISHTDNGGVKLYRDQVIAQGREILVKASGDCAEGSVKILQGHRGINGVLEHLDRQLVLPRP